MELSQGNSLGSYLYLKQAKNVMFFFLLIQNQGTGGWNRFLGRGGISGRGEVAGKGVEG
jgi:hypothetical protein